MSQIVYTAPLRYDGDDRLDVSRWGNHPLGVFFAPSERLLNGYKRQRNLGLGTDAMRRLFALYGRRYATELAQTRRDYPHAWATLRAMPVVTLCCYCRGPSMCHRVLLAQALVADGAVYDGERSFER